MADIDLRSTGMGNVNYVAKSTKDEAIASAKSFGLSAKLVRRAANRFWRFWIIADSVGSDSLRIWNNDGTWVDVKHPGIW